MSLSKLPRDFVSTACYPRAMAYSSADLKMADDHIALGERHVIRQRELLAFLKSHGHPIDVAEDLLAEFEATLVQHRLHRAQMLTELEPDPLQPGPPGEAGPRASPSPKTD